MKNSNKKLYERTSLHPFKYITPSVGNITLSILCMLVLQVIMLFATKSFASIFVLLASLIASVAAEGLYTGFSKKTKFNAVVSIIQGLVIGLLLPSTYQLPAVFFIVFSSTLILKISFGSFSSSWVNICLVTVIAAYVINPQAFPLSSFSLIDLQSRNPALNLVQTNSVPLVKFDTSITQFFNKFIFGLFGVSVPDGYVSLFWDCYCVIPAFRFNFITLISGIILISFDFIDSVIPAVFLFVYCLLVRLVLPLVIQGIPLQGDMLLALLTSGTLFACVFLMQWFGTTPITLWGKIVYGAFGGIMAFLIAGYGASSTGIIFSVLIMNIFSPVIQYFESKQVKGFLKKVLLPQINELKETENV